MAAMMALPANGAMYVGGELGANWIASTNLKATGAGYSPALAAPVGFGLKYSGMAFQPAVIGGATLGYDFVNAGFAGYAWPDWMKYFGFMLDFTYNRVIIKNQNLPVSGMVTAGGANVTPILFPNGKGNLFSPTGASSNSSIPVLAFVFYGHYGFFPDSEIAVGRVHPYIGVGPAIAWTNLDLGPYGLATKSSCNIALATEAGIRFIALPTVTIDLGFRYRYLTPNWSRSGNMSVSTQLGPVYLSPAALKASVDSINSFSFLCRVAYHF